MASHFAANTETQTLGHYVCKVIDIRSRKIQHDLHSSAYYLHPKYRGDGGMLTVERSSVYRRFLAD